MQLKDKKVLVVGLGVSGVAVCKFLVAEGAEVSATDSADSVPCADELSGIGVELELGGHDPSVVDGCDLVVASPGVPDEALPLVLAADKGIPVIGELELGARFCPAKIVAITGTNGKSTTTELIGNILSSAGVPAVVCGNIGTPLTALLGDLDEDSVAVVEVSSFQLERTVLFKPFVSVLLNVAEDHYERHGDLEGYKKAKLRIFSNQDEEDWAVIHSGLCDDPELVDMKCRKVFYGLDMGPIRIEGGDLVFEEEGSSLKIIGLDSLPVEGKHNIENIMCASLVGKILGVTVPDIQKGIITFSGLSHRFERIGVYSDIEYIDDSKATNIDATKRALESIDKKVVLIAGGIDKGGDYGDILPLIGEMVSAMVLIGEAGDKIGRVFEGEVKVVKADTMADAVKAAGNIAAPGEAVLLSPMCSSFDMFSGYKERGEIFQNEVRKLYGEK